MRRRRTRGTSEIAFSLDSFLDVVANVVGIIIRLILVVWVGARTYSSIKPPLLPSIPIHAQPETIHDPLTDELDRRRQELAAAQDNLTQQLRDLEAIRGQRTVTASELAGLNQRRQLLEQQRASVARALLEREQDRKAAALSLAELAQRSTELTAEIRNLDKHPSQKRTLRYHTPVSRPVDAEELFFECRRGRVTFIDIGALLGELKRTFRDKGDKLRNNWQVSDTVGPAGAFRMRYTLERVAGGSVSPLPLQTPDPDASFRAELAGWVLEPLTDQRGENEQAAMAPGSEFRRIADALDPQQMTVTFWVYPDSFALYRQLRDYLAERDVQVAGRPLPPGVPIASSREGSASRGQ